MIINKIPNTCSMVELGGLNYTSDIESVTIDDFDKKLKVQLVEACESYHAATKIKCVLYNTNLTWSQRITLWHHGFKKIGSYQGNTSEYRTHIMIKKIKW